MNNIEKVQAAIDYIEDHLTEKLDLDVIAGAVHYSKYHLHRVFSKTVGLTLHEYRNRRQLTEAAKLLVFSEGPILDIALLAGYESQQAFTTAFSAMYKQSPSQYRENEKFYPLQLRFQFEGSYNMRNSTEKTQWKITYADESDIPCWMALVHLVIDGFPHLYEEEYVGELKRRIRKRQALILKDGEAAVGAVLIPDADSRHYSDAYERSLLYVACTRAMHSLTLLYSGEISALIPETL
jgi:AraC-like DNA-binding protein